MRKNIYLPLLALAAAMLFFACDRKNDELWQDERAQIRTYLQNQGISNYTEDPDAGYFYYFTQVDSSQGAHPNINSIVELYYTTSFLDGTELYRSPIGTPDLIDLDKAVAGWQLAMPYFYVGTKGVLLLPSRLAYGPDGYGSVPPNTILKFEMAIVEIHPHF